MLSLDPGRTALEVTYGYAFMQVDLEGIEVPLHVG
jgi:hypothetical protein